MSKKRKNKSRQCNQMHMSPTALAILFAVTLALGVFASLAHMDALDRIDAAEARLSDIENMQKHITTFLSGRSME